MDQVELESLVLSLIDKFGADIMSINNTGN
jgi:hypothetical protein